MQGSNTKNIILAASLVVLPILLFYAILFHFALNIPFRDDYDAILNYLNQSSQIPTLSGRLLYLMTAQHNEYKLVFPHAVFWLQYALFHDVNLKLTCALGNLLVLPIGWLLWKMFLPQETNIEKRLALFAPVSLLLFQLNYVETLDWAMSGLPYTGVLFFSLSCIYLLFRPTPASFAGSLVMLVLAIFTIGNGLFLIPIGLLVLVLDRNRNYLKIAIWLGISLLCVAGYAYHYYFIPTHHSTSQMLLHLHPFYIVIFMGSAAFLPIKASGILGLALIAVLGYLLYLGYWHKNPLVSCCILFILITAIGVAGIRSDHLDIAQATASRYRIYSDLLIIFSWFAFVELFLEKQVTPLRSNRLYTTALALALLYCLGTDAGATRFLIHRDHDLVRGMTLYYHPQPLQPPGPTLSPPNHDRDWDAFNAHARAVLIRSTQLGIYHPPKY